MVYMSLFLRTWHTKPRDRRKKRTHLQKFRKINMSAKNQRTPDDKPSSMSFLTKMVASTLQERARKNRKHFFFKFSFVFFNTNKRQLQKLVICRLVWDGWVWDLISQMTWLSNIPDIMSKIAFSSAELYIFSRIPQKLPVKDQSFG